MKDAINTAISPDGKRLAAVPSGGNGAVFDVETGEPTEGPAQDALPVFQAREVDGWVEVATRPGEG